MKALITAAVLSVAVVAATSANAHKHVVVVEGPLYVPTATCATHATKSPLPEYVCCKMKSHAKDAWSKTWVSGGCATVGARFDLRCDINSPVLGTGAPINAQCQFSHSTGMMPVVSK